MRLLLTLATTFLICATSLGQTKRPLPVLQTIEEGVVARHSPNKDAYGMSLPPWKDITIDNVFFKQRPATGDAVTVIPLNFDISPLTLRIVKTKKAEDGCDEHLPVQWEVALEPITQKEFFEVAGPSDRNAEFPFDVVILYPAVKAARLLKNDQLDSKSLPRGVTLKTVKAAIDLDADNRPDVVVTEYCCLAPTQPLTACDYTCGKTYKKVRNMWKLIDTSSPC